MSVLNDDVNQLERFLDMGANEVLQITTNAIVVGGIFFIWSRKQLCIRCYRCPLSFGVHFIFNGASLLIIIPCANLLADSIKKLLNNLSGIVTIKSFTTEATEAQSIGKLSDQYRVANHKVIDVASTFTPLLRMLVEGSFIFTLIRGAFLVESGALSVASYSVMIFWYNAFCGHSQGLRKLSICINVPKPQASALTIFYKHRSQLKMAQTLCHCKLATGPFA